MTIYGIAAPPTNEQWQGSGASLSDVEAAAGALATGALSASITDIRAYQDPLTIPRRPREVQWTTFHYQELDRLGMPFNDSSEAYTPPDPLLALNQRIVSEVAGYPPDSKVFRTLSLKPDKWMLERDCDEETATMLEQLYSSMGFDTTTKQTAYLIYAWGKDYQEVASYESPLGVQAVEIRGFLSGKKSFKVIVGTQNANHFDTFLPHNH